MYSSFCKLLVHLYLFCFHDDMTLKFSVMSTTEQFVVIKTKEGSYILNGVFVLPPSFLYKLENNGDRSLCG